MMIRVVAAMSLTVGCGEHTMPKQNNKSKNAPSQVARCQFPTGNCVDFRADTWAALKETQETCEQRSVPVGIWRKAQTCEVTPEALGCLFTGGTYTATTWYNDPNDRAAEIIEICLSSGGEVRESNR